MLLYYCLSALKYHSSWSLSSLCVNLLYLLQPLQVFQVGHHVIELCPADLFLLKGGHHPHAMARLEPNREAGMAQHFRAKAGLTCGVAAVTVPLVQDLAIAYMRIAQVYRSAGDGFTAPEGAGEEAQKTAEQQAGAYQ